MAYIINRYNKYDQWDREHQRKVFEINGNEYAVFEVEMEWGLPRLPYRIDGMDTEQSVRQIHVYDTYQDVMKFVVLMKSLN